VTTLAILQGFIAAFLGLTSLGCLLAAADSGEWGLVALFLGGLAAASLVCAYGLWTMQSRGRRLQLWLAALGLICVPVGTLIGALVLFYLTRPHVRRLFQDDAPPVAGPAGD
jgi:hypothetical protein